MTKSITGAEWVKIVRFVNDHREVLENSTTSGCQRILSDHLGRTVTNKQWRAIEANTGVQAVRTRESSSEKGERPPSLRNEVEAMRSDRMNLISLCQNMATELQELRREWHVTLPCDVTGT